MKKLDRAKMEQFERMLSTISGDVKALKDKRFNEKMTEMRFVGIAFDPNKYKDGENQVNKALGEGFEIMRDFETGGGIVMCLAKWKKKTKVNNK